MSDKKVAKKSEGEKKVVKKVEVKKATETKTATKKPAEKKEVKKETKDARKETKSATIDAKGEKVVKDLYNTVPGEPPSFIPAGFDEVEWTSRESIVKVFPAYMQAQLGAVRGKPLSKVVDLYPYDMKAPFGTDYLLRDAQVLLEANKKQGLIGDAGCGKTTLFVELAKQNHKEFPKHIYVHHCKEIELTENAMSVIDTVVRAHEYRNTLLECEKKLAELVSADPKPAAKTLAALKENFEYVKLMLQRINSATAYDRAGKMLRVLGFDEEGQRKSTNALSGGLRMRVALCAAFFIEPDLLLLDEPTNHLDFPSVLWLENRLRSHRGSFVMVSHDRDLLKNVCTSIIMVEEKRLSYHACNFTEFERKREIAWKKKAEDIDKFIARNRVVDFSTPIAKEKKEKQAWLDFYQQRMILLAGKFTFPDATPLKNDDPSVPDDQISLINVKNVTFTYKEETGIWIFKNPIDIDITATTRMGIMGPNGAGKSTFLKLITNKLTPSGGEITTHKTATVAYFAQHHVLDLDLVETPMEYMIRSFPKVEKTGFLRSHLAKVGIVGDKAETRMQSLSGGLRSCVCFAKITYYCPHLLIMDEPTNFLDLESIDSLIAATNKYKGALLLVSHNRGFLLKCAKQYLSIVPGKFEVFDELKKCERATYQFIEEMESGVKVGAQDLVRKNPSADAAVAARTGVVKKEEAPKKSDGSFTISSSAAHAKPAAPKPSVPKATPEEEKLVGRKCTATWAADGGKYPAVILKATGDGGVEVQYKGYPDKAIVKVKDIVLAK